MNNVLISVSIRILFEDGTIYSKHCELSSSLLDRIKNRYNLRVGNILVRPAVTEGIRSPYVSRCEGSSNVSYSGFPEFGGKTSAEYLRTLAIEGWILEGSE